MKKALILKGFQFAFCILHFAICTNLSHAQQVEFSSSLNPVGSGARATGMGGAFIGVADDATAASWNPAGLVQLEKPEMSLVYGGFSREQAYSSPIHPEIDTSNTMDSRGINYASAVYPFVSLNRNCVVSLNYQRLYEMNKKVKLNYLWDLGGGDTLNDAIVFDQKGHLYALSPAMAVQIVPALYLGATLNFWGDYLDKNGWENTYRSSAFGNVMGNERLQKVEWKNALSFRGMNTHLGFLWNISQAFTLGGVYKSAFDGRLRKETSIYQRQEVPALAMLIETTGETSENLIMKMPASYGLGLQYRGSDSFTVGCDVYRTAWSRFFLKDAAGNEINPIDGRALSEGRLNNTVQVRLGMEYLFINDKRTIPLRAGFLYDPEPSKGKLDDFYGASFGTGYASGPIAIDMAYQYRIGRNVSGDISSIPGSSVDINQQTVMMSIIYYL